jgi:hypothetical protein
MAFLHDYPDVEGLRIISPAALRLLLDDGLPVPEGSNSQARCGHLLFVVLSTAHCT